MALVLTQIPPNGTTPPLYRGEPFGFQIGPTKPVVSLTGKTIKVHVDNRDDPVAHPRLTIQGADITVDPGGTFATFNKVPPWSSDNLVDGNYRILVVVDGRVWGTYFMLVGTSEGGLL